MIFCTIFTIYLAVKKKKKERKYTRGDKPSPGNITFYSCQKENKNKEVVEVLYYETG